MAEQKTRKTAASVDAFLQGIADPGRRDDCRALVEMMEEVTGEQPRLWGTSIVGFGDHHYRYASGHEGDTFLVGLSPRKDAITVYLHWLEPFEAILDRLGKHKRGKGCLYLRGLADVDPVVLRELLETASAAKKRA